MSPQQKQVVAEWWRAWINPQTIITVAAAMTVIATNATKGVILVSNLIDTVHYSTASIRQIRDELSKMKVDQQDRDKRQDIRIERAFMYKQSNK